MPKSKLTTEEMRTLREQGLTYDAISKLAGTSRQGVHQKLNPVNRKTYWTTDKCKAYQKAYYQRKKIDTILKN